MEKWLFGFYILRLFPKFKLIQWWIKDILQLEIKIQWLFDSLGPSSLLALINLFLNIQIEVYKACRLPRLLSNSCLNFNVIQTLELPIPYYGCLITFFFSFHFISYFHLFFSILLTLSFGSCVVGYLSLMVLTSHTSQLSCKCEKEKPKIFLPL